MADRIHQSGGSVPTAPSSALKSILESVITDVGPEKAATACRDIGVDYLTNDKISKLYEEVRTVHVSIQQALEHSRQR